MSKYFSLSNNYNDDVFILNKLRKYIKNFKQEINHSRKNGVPSLITICEKVPKLQFIKLLVEAGADVNVKCYLGMNCLFYVFLHRSYFDPNVVDYLISQGCNINAKPTLGSTILHTLIFNQIITEEKFKILMKYSPNMINERDINKVVPLTAICTNCPSLKLIELFVEYGADINYPDQNCLDSLKNVKSLNEIIKYFVFKGININQINYSENSLLHIFIENENIEYDTLKLLITPEIINLKNSYGETPLLKYIKNIKLLDFKVIELLINSGADPTINNRHGVNSLFYLFTGNRKITVKSVKLLVSKGCNFNQKDIYRNTILHEIAKNPSFGKLEIFQKFNNKIENEMVNDYNTPLIILSKNSKAKHSHKVMKMFVEFGYKVSQREKDICLFNLICNCVDINSEIEKNLKYLIQKGFKIKLFNNDDDILGFNDIFKTKVRKISKLMFLVNQNLPLGKLKIIHREKINYLGVKYNPYSFCSYQLYY